MNTQDKNRLLAIVVMAMLASIIKLPTPSNTTTQVLIPSDAPVMLAVVEVRPPSASRDQFECMQKNVYFEARNESVRGMQAVALVTVARTQTKHFPDTICDVVKASAVSKKTGKLVCQFSWYCDGKEDRPNLDHPMERKQWLVAGEVAREVMNGEVNDFLGRSTNYHADYVKPDWSVDTRMQRLVTIGRHIFYRDVKLGVKA